MRGSTFLLTAALLALVAFVIAGCIPVTGPQGSGDGSDNPAAPDPAAPDPDDGSDDPTDDPDSGPVLSYTQRLHRPSVADGSTGYYPVIDLSFGAGAVYAALATEKLTDGVVTRLDPATQEWGELAPGGTAYDTVACSRDEIWVLDTSAAAQTRTKESTKENTKENTKKNDTAYVRGHAHETWLEVRPNTKLFSGLDMTTVKPVSGSSFVGTTTGIYRVDPGSGTDANLLPLPTDSADPRYDIAVSGLAWVDPVLFAAATDQEPGTPADQITVDRGVILWYADPATGEETWMSLTKETNGLPSNDVHDVAAGGGTLYAGTSSGLAAATLDEADPATTSFSLVPLGSELPEDQPRVNQVHISGEAIYVATHAGLWYSPDAGSNWDVVRRGSTLPADDPAISTDEVLSVSTLGDSVFAGMPGVGIVELVWE